MKPLFIISTILLFIASCRPDAKQSNINKQIHFEFIRLGLPENLRSEDTPFVGAMFYLRELSNDSMYVKIQPMNNMTGDRDTLSRSFVISPTKIFKQALHRVIKYLHKIDLDTGEIPGSNPGAQAIYCGGAYILSFTDNNDTRKVFYFRRYHIDSSLVAFMDAYHVIIQPLLDRPASGTMLFYNTDSITRHYSRCLGMDTIVLLGPARSTIKFTPPEIIPEK